MSATFILILQYMIAGSLSKQIHFAMLNKITPAYFSGLLNTIVCFYYAFYLMLGITMVAAPGVPDGSVIAAIGLLKSMLDFDTTIVFLMIALYLAQDSLGTACNILEDGAITSITDSISKRITKLKDIESTT